METFDKSVVEIDGEESNSRNSSLLRSESFEEEMKELQSFTKIEALCELEEEIGRLRNENKLLRAKYSNLFKLHKANITRNYNVGVSTDVIYGCSHLPVIQETDESCSPKVPLQGSLEDREPVLDNYKEDDCDSVYLNNLNECSLRYCDNFDSVEDDNIRDTVFDIKRKLHVLYKILDGPDDVNSALNPVFQKVCKAMGENSHSPKSFYLEDVKKKLKYLSSYVENLINKQQDLCDTFYNYFNNDTEDRNLFPKIEECRNKLAESFAIDLNLKVTIDDICLKIERLCKENDSYEQLTLVCDTIMGLIGNENYQSTKVNKIEKNLETLKQLMGILEDIINIVNITNKTDTEKKLEDTLNNVFISKKVQNNFTRIISLVEFVDLNFKDLKTDYLNDLQKISFLKTFWLKCCDFVKSGDNINESQQLIMKVSEDFQEEKLRLIFETQKHKNECDILTKQVETSKRTIDALKAENHTLNETLTKYEYEQKTTEEKHIKKNKEVEILLNELTTALKSKEEIIANYQEEIDQKNNASQVSQEAINKIEELKNELTASTMILVQQVKKLEQKNKQLEKSYSIKIATASQELEKMHSNLLVSEKTLDHSKKLQRDLKVLIAEKEDYAKQAQILKIKLQRARKVENIFTDKTEVYEVLLTALKEKSTEEDTKVTKIEAEFKHLENQIKLKHEPIMLFILKLLEMFKIMKQALVKSHKTFAQTQTEKIYNLELQLAKQKANYQKGEEETDFKISVYKKRLSDLENKFKQLWINGSEHLVLQESNQNIWKMKRTAEQDRRRSLGRGVFESPSLALDISDENSDHIIESKTKGQHKEGAVKTNLAANQVLNSESTLNEKDEADAIKKAENTHLRMSKHINISTISQKK